MKHYILCTLIIGYLCVVVFGSSEETLKNSTDLEESHWNSTYTPVAQNENDTIVQQGVKAKVKGVYNKVKNKVKEIGNKVKNKVKEIGNKVKNKGKEIGNKVKNKVKEIGNKIKDKGTQIGKDTNTGKDRGRYPSGYRFNRNTNYSTNYDSTTLIWIALGTIGGSLLIIFIYAMWKYSK